MGKHVPPVRVEWSTPCSSGISSHQLCRRVDKLDVYEVDKYYRQMAKAPSLDRIQVNVRISQELARSLDEKRVQLQKTQGAIPSRSDVVRMAIEAFVAKPEKKR